MTMSDTTLPQRAGPLATGRWLGAVGGTILALLFFSLFFASTAQAQDLGSAPEQAERMDDEGAFHDNVIRIKLQTEVADLVQPAVEGGIAQLGIGSIDQLNVENNAVSAERLFSHGGEFEERRRAHGLHQWYEIRFADDVATADAAVQELTEAYSADPNVEVAEARARAQTYIDETSVLQLPDPPDDPLYEDQYNYNNTGQTGGTPGADISAEGGWAINTGDASVVVAIHDTGVDGEFDGTDTEITHPDLIPTAWENPDWEEGEESIHGKNFSEGDPADIADDDPAFLGGGHGTHVTGTVAAATNDGFGVAGVAGGNGEEGSGARYMVLTDIGEEDQYPYAADNGAVISQNSWGYTAAGFFPEAMEDAIDYFIAEAGHDAEGNPDPDAPMHGGMVVFAAGNSNADEESYPAFHDPVVAVGATDHNDERAIGWGIDGTDGSNYGDWVDIAAPGDAILSTVPADQGEFATFSGTSMAAPHVSGAAALVLSEFDDVNTPEQVLDILVESGDEIDTDQPIGPRLNIETALQEDDGIAPDAIADLAVEEVEASWAELSWSAPEGNPSVYDLRYSDQPIEDETDFEMAEQADAPSPSAPGTVQSTVIEGLTPDTEYYFAIRSSDAFGNTSDLSNIVSATTDVAPVLAFDPEETEFTLGVGDSGQDMMQVLNVGEGTLNFDITGISYGGSELTDPIEVIPAAETASVEYEATPPEDISAGPVPEDIEPLTDYSQPVLTMDWLENTQYWGVLSTGVGVNDFGYFTGDDPSNFNILGDYPGTAFSGAGAFPEGEDSYLYEIDNEGDLRQIFVDDGEVIELGSVGSDWTGLATDPTDGTLYATRGTGLYTLDVDNLEYELIGSYGLDFMISIAIDGEGQMYGYDLTSNDFFAIDKETADIEVIGDIGFDANFGQGMVWDAEHDEIVMAAFNAGVSQAEFRIVDRETGNTEYIGDLEDQTGWISTPVDGPGQWLAADPLEGTVEADDAMDIDLFFETVFEEDDDLVGGLNYFADVQFETNDPSQESASYPVTLTVEGEDEIVADDVIDFGSTFAGTTVTEMLTISNEGNTVVQAGAFALESDVFDVNGGLFTLDPGSSVEVPVSFSPDASETFDATLFFESSVGTIEVELTGEGAPFVAIDPDELSESIDLTTGDSTATQTFSVTNEFDEALPVSIFIQSLQSEDVEFTPNLVDEQLLRWQEQQSVAPTGDSDLEPSMDTAPDSDERSLSGDVRGFAELMDEAGVIGYANEVLEDEIVSFDLGIPEELTVLDGGVDSFAGNFIFGNNEEIYWIDNADNYLKTYNLEDGSVEELGELEGEGTEDEGWTDIETDFTDGTTYVTTAEDDGGWITRIYELDPNNAEIEYLGSWDGLTIAFAIDDEGYGFGHELTGDEVLSIDLDTFEAEVLGPTGIDANFAQSMTYDHETDQLLMAALHDCTIFGCNQGDLRYVDRATGETFLIGPFGDDGVLREMGWFATEGTGIQWLSTNITQATIQPGATVDVTATFDASELIEGDYEAQISIVGEQLPGQPAEHLPVFLTVDGEPIIFLSQEELEFGELFVNDTSAPQHVTIRNDGAADLNVTDVSSDLEYFLVDGPDSFTLEPGQAEVFEVTFAPGSVGEFDGTLTFEGEEASGEVALSGEGIPAPEIAVDPEGFDTQILIGQTDEFDLEVTNVGADTLEYEAAIGTNPNPMSPDGAFEVILEEDFEQMPPEGWMRAGANDGENWTDECFGRPEDLLPAAVFCWSPSTDGTQRLITPAMETGAYTEILVQFEHTVNNFGSTDDFEIRLESTGDGGDTWTTVAEFPADDVPPTEEMIAIDNDDVGSDEFHLAWTFEGNSFNINEWGFTDLSVYGEVAWLTIDPEEGALEADESLVHTLSVDATDLEEDLYELGVIVNSNDPVTPTAFVPFTLNVIENITVSTDDMELNPNETGTVPLTVESLDDLDVISYQFTLEYDDELIEAIDVNTEGTLSEDAEIAVNIEDDGVISVAAFDVGTDGTEGEGGPALFQIEGEGTLIELEIQAQEALGDVTPVATEFLFNEGLDSQTGPGAEAELGTISVVPLYGDVALNLEVTSFDAALALQSTVGLADLNEAQQVSGDVSGSGTVGSFDAGLIQQFVVGLIDSFPVEDDGDALVAATTEETSASFAWSEAETEGTTSELPLEVEEANGPVTAVSVTAPIDASVMEIEDVQSHLPDDWMIAHNVEDDVLHIAMAGATPLESGQLATVGITWLDDDAQVTFDSEVAVNENAPQSLSAEIGTVPDEFVLHENYPNPFRNETTIEYELPEATHVRIVVYNVLGQEVGVLVDEEQNAGRYDVSWDGRSITGTPVSSGVYIYRIEAGDFTDTQRATRVR